MEKENKKVLEENPYEGLSVMESIKKYNSIDNFFISNYHAKLLDKIRSEIINRIFFFFDKDADLSVWLVHLPFAIMMWNNDGDVDCDGNRTRFYSTMGTDGTSIILHEFQWDDEECTDVSYSHKLSLYDDENIILYQELYRMGFFDKKYEEEFMENVG